MTDLTAKGSRYGPAEGHARLMLSLAVAILTGAVVWAGHSPPASISDFDSAWLGARAISHGRDPYAEVRQAIDQGKVLWPLFYPGTAVVLIAPLGLLPIRAAVSIFSALGCGLLAFSLRERWRLGMLLSAPALHAVVLGQWSPVLVAATSLPWLGFVWAAKSSVGLAFFAGWPSRQAVIGCALLFALSFMLVPHWPAEWLTALHDTPHYRAPIFRPFGWLLLLAWLRWRTPEARFVGMLALIPHSTGLYETLALLLVARSVWELAALQVLGYVAAYAIYTHTQISAVYVARALDQQWPYLLIFCYLPPLILLLTPLLQRKSHSRSPQRALQ